MYSSCVYSLLALDAVVRPGQRRPRSRGRRACRTPCTPRRVMSLLARAHSAEAWLTVSSSSVGDLLLASRVPLFLLHHDGQRDVVGVLADDGLAASSSTRNSSSPSRRCSVTSVPRAALVDRLDGEVALAAGLPAHALLGRRAPARRGHDRHLVGDDERRNRSRRRTGRSGCASLASGRRSAREKNSRVPDLAMVPRCVDRPRRALMPMPLSVMVRVRAALSKATRIFEVGVVLVQRGVVQRLEAQLVAGVGGVGDQLAQEDLLVASTASGSSGAAAA